MCQIWLRSDSRVEKKGGDLQTERQTDKLTLQLYIVDDHSFKSTRFRHFLSLRITHGVQFLPLCIPTSPSPDSSPGLTRTPYRGAHWTMSPCNPLCGLALSPHPLRGSSSSEHLPWSASCCLTPSSRCDHNYFQVDQASLD